MSTSLAAMVRATSLSQLTIWQKIKYSSRKITVDDQSRPGLARTSRSAPHSEY